ncbi:hypothetical protein N7533_008439 [Penicillium manginii]|jgi:transposase|uniref:uncharacterized protein n=1 Tax=Penicillium manginii TaxID=203109 RepID=UPI002547D159|nr:uncharacterized protein N7533_008439 [Penicillium manginii]KAJ5743569.1 hypothetical protein N7533_008439 [Penicillium manginii]
MPPPTPEQSTNDKPMRGKELTPYIRGHIAGASMAGASLTTIANYHGISKSTVQYTLKMQAKRNEGQTVVRTGRPSKISGDDLRAIIAALQRGPSMSCNDIRIATGIDASNHTILRSIRRAGYDWKASQWVRANDTPAEKE